MDKLRRRRTNAGGRPWESFGCTMCVERRPGWAGVMGGHGGASTRGRQTSGSQRGVRRLGQASWWRAGRLADRQRRAGTLEGRARGPAHPVTAAPSWSPLRSPLRSVSSVAAGWSGQCVVCQQRRAGQGEGYAPLTLTRRFTLMPYNDSAAPARLAGMWRNGEEYCRGRVVQRGHTRSSQRVRRGAEQHRKSCRG